MAEPAMDGLFPRALTAGSYPAVMLIAFGLYALLIHLGAPVMIASYCGALTGAVLITAHEFVLPYRAAWRPNGGEVGTDAIFMLSVQVALPFLLSISVIVALSDVLLANDLTFGFVWPHEWPVAVQACLMLLAADFVRYWMHRAFHRFTPLWRFHAVHHSPHRLYWLNVGRFHPIEKAIQYAVDAAPFALLGVAPEVLAAYFVFYAINGFFQHSNCKVRLGPLNYLISGPELHRWHHSKLPRESDKNFGNNLIVWDLLFGTRFLPRDREVGPLGLINRAYPMGFLAQLKTPFIRGIENG